MVTFNLPSPPIPTFHSIPYPSLFFLFLPYNPSQLLLLITTLFFFGKGQQFQSSPTKRMYQNYSYSMPRPYQSVEMPKTFPEDIECIITAATPDRGSLYISNVEAASNPSTLKRFRITAVMSCAKGYELKHPRTVVPHYKYIPTVDDQKCDISPHFDDAVAFIDGKLKQTNVLVHCIAGVSRSVSMVLAYFIKEHGMHYEEAYRLVKAKRKIIHPNDGFIRQLKQYSETLKTQQRNARKAREEVSPNRSIEKSVSIDKQRETGNSSGYLDRTMPDFKSIQLMPHRETPPQRTANDRRGELYERYASTQMKSPVYKRTSSYTRDQPPFQSLQQIPEPPPPQAQEPTLTPKASKQLEKYELVRTSTNYFTPSKPTLLNQKPYESTRKYDDYSRFDKTPPSHNLTHTQDTLRPDLKEGRTKLTGTEAFSGFSGNRGEYFASKNTELDDKIELIRRKYAAEREKLFTKFQSPQKEQHPPQDESNDRRRASLGEFKDRPVTMEGGSRYGTGRTETKQQQPVFQRTSHLQSYGQLYSRKYERIGSFALNQEESYSNKLERPTRGSIYETGRRETGRDYAQLAYPSSYSPYYKYGSSFKRYY